MKESENMKIAIVSCFAAILIFGLTGCGNTMKGFETDIYEKRKAVSDFVSPLTDEVPVDEEKKEVPVDEEKKEVPVDEEKKSD